jgi:hypothetical protein
MQVSYRFLANSRSSPQARQLSRPGWLYIVRDPDDARSETVGAGSKVPERPRMRGCSVAVPIGELLRPTPTPAGAAQAATGAMTAPSRMKQSVEVVGGLRGGQDGSAARWWSWGGAVVDSGLVGEDDDLYAVAQMELHQDSLHVGLDC